MKSVPTVDVFTDRQFGGNPLAVVTDAQGLSTEQMQSIAAEFNLAETTFVLPPKDPAHTAEVRIFTPKAEMPFAGHPNVGTAFVLARRQCGRPSRATGWCSRRRPAWCRMDLTREAASSSPRVWPHRSRSASARTVAAEIVADGLLARSRRHQDRRHRPVIASCGAPLPVRRADARARRSSRRRRDADVFARAPAEERTVGIHLYVQAKEDGVDIQSRMFAPLYRHARGSGDRRRQRGADRPAGASSTRGADLTLAKTIGQGFDMGRPSILEASAEKKAGTVDRDLYRRPLRADDERHDRPHVRSCAGAHSSDASCSLDRAHSMRAS